MEPTTQTRKARPNAEAAHDSTYVPRGSVIAELKFYAPPADGAKPFNYPGEIEPPQGLPKRNFGDADIPVTITDIRGRESFFNLDDNGFCLLKSGSSAKVDFMSAESIEQVYYPEVEKLLLQSVPGAERVLPFDYTVRPSAGFRPPVLRVHIDQTPAAAAGRVRHFLPDEAQTLLENRVRIINVWRPLNGPVQCSPLAFADSRTVPDESLVAVEHRYPDRVGETISVKHADEKWYYWSGMANDERLLLECFDSEKGGRVPHSAFEDPRSPVGARPRESVEVRALVFG